MPLGPGKYDDVCTLVREKVGLIDQNGLMVREGGVIVIVMGGDKGNGFACQSDLHTLVVLPDMLEDMAKQIRQSSVF